MTTGPAGAADLFHPGASALHRLPAEAKVLALTAYLFVVVATPAREPWAFAWHAAALVVLVAVAGIPAALVARRLRVEVPFLAFAALLPVLGPGPRIDVLGIGFSEAGMWGAWNVAAKATLGLLAAILLTATTAVADLLAGLHRLRVPAALIAIASLMVRYLGVIRGEADRMRIARLSRGDDPRWWWQARGVATSTGTLFVRAYERGERVHLAMCARGFDGSMPDLRDRGSGRRGWWATALPAWGAAGLAGARLLG